MMITSKNLLICLIYIMNIILLIYRVRIIYLLILPLIINFCISHPKLLSVDVYFIDIKEVTLTPYILNIGSGLVEIQVVRELILRHKLIVIYPTFHQSNQIIYCHQIEVLRMIFNLVFFLITIFSKVLIQPNFTHSLIVYAYTKYVYAKNIKFVK